jgi:hypothetical protein
VSHDREMQAMRELVSELSGNMRRAVHDVKDTSQVAINKMAAAELRGRGDSDGEGRKG